MSYNTRFFIIKAILILGFLLGVGVFMHPFSKEAEVEVLEVSLAIPIPT